MIQLRSPVQDDDDDDDDREEKDKDVHVEVFLMSRTTRWDIYRLQYYTNDSSSILASVFGSSQATEKSSPALRCFCWLFFLVTSDFIPRSTNGSKGWLEQPYRIPSCRCLVR